MRPYCNPAVHPLLVTIALSSPNAWATTAGASPGWQDIIQPLLGWGLAFGLILLLFAILQGRHQPQARLHKHGRLLLVIGMVLLLALALPFWDALNPKETSTKATRSADLTVTCTASQWKWHFDYTTYHGQPLDGPRFISAMQTPPAIDSDALARQLFSPDANRATADERLAVDHPLVLPAGKRVRFHITAEDSVHAWWIPGLGVKKDAIPGFLQPVEVTLPEQPGVFRGLCSQLCGQDTAFMPIVIKVVPADVFENWLSDTRAALARQAARPIAPTLSPEDLLRRGEALYHERCTLCHLSDGEGANGRIPALANSAMLAGPLVPLLDLLRHGRNSMPGMEGILARDELAALASYIRNRWGHSSATDAIVQPAQLPEAF